MDADAFIAAIRAKRLARGPARLSRIEARIWAVDAYCRGEVLDEAAARELAVTCRWLGQPLDAEPQALRRALVEQLRAIYAE
jgi:hypothetical protein